MVETATPEARPGTIKQVAEKPKSGLEPGYLVVCWNDPVNYMSYVTHVFQVIFGWSKAKADQHMLQVHEQGKSVLVRESMEKADFPTVQGTVVATAVLVAVATVIVDVALAWLDPRTRAELV